MMMIETLPCDLEPVDQIQDDGAFLHAHGGQRLVEQQDLGFRIDRAGDRDRLALPAGQLGDLGIHRRDVHAHVVEVLLGLLAHGPVAQQRPADLLPVQEHVVVDGELVDQREVLVHRVDAERAGVVDRLDRDLLALQDDPPAGGRLEAAEDLEQGGFARAVVADQAEHLAALEVHVHVDQRRDGPVLLGDVLDPEHVAVRVRRHGRVLLRLIGHLRPALSHVAGSAARWRSWRSGWRRRGGWAAGSR